MVIITGKGKSSIERFDKKLCIIVTFSKRESRKYNPDKGIRPCLFHPIHTTIARECRLRLRGDPDTGL